MKSDWPIIDDFIDMEPAFRKAVEKNLKEFPEDLECPDDLKRWLSARAGFDKGLETFLDSQLEGLSKSTIRETLKAKEFDEVRLFLRKGFEYFMSGGGSL